MRTPTARVTQAPRFLANPSIGKAAAALAVYEGVNTMQQRAHDLKARLMYLVAVDETDDLYPAVHDWVLQLLPPRRQRSLTATTARRGRSRQPDSHTTPPTTLRFHYSDRRARPAVVDGHRVMVQFEEPEGLDTAASSPLRDRPVRPARIVFGAWTHAGQQAVVNRLHALHEQGLASRTPVLRMVTSWGSWSTREDLPPRSLASVALPADQKTRIVEDLRGFLAAEEQYNHLAVPWHRGYMFHGPPGTGKTSLVRALASEFGLDLWYISLSDLKAESGLLTLLADVGPRSMLLLEDIDTVEITHARDTRQGSISMSSLLNALDGVATPHGLITVMTTNHFDKLDPALTRAGRMDVVERLDYLTPATLSDLFTHYYGRTLATCLEVTNLPAAAAAEVFKRHLHDPDGAAAALTALQAGGGVR